MQKQCSDTESAKTIKKLRDVVDSLSACLRTGGLRSQHAASDVQVLQKQIIKLESKVNGLHDDLAAPSKVHIKVNGMLTLGVRDALAGQVLQNGVSFPQAYTAVITMSVTSDLVTNGTLSRTGFCRTCKRCRSLVNVRNS